MSLFKSMRATREAYPGPLNASNEIMARANCSIVLVDPKPGLILLGERGIEFDADTGGFVQIPWEHVTNVRCDVYRRYVRSIEVQTDEGQAIPFVVSKGGALLRCIRDHIGRENIHSIYDDSPANGHSLRSKLKQIAKRKK